MPSCSVTGAVAARFGGRVIQFPCFSESSAFDHSVKHGVVERCVLRRVSSTEVGLASIVCEMPGRFKAVRPQFLNHMLKILKYLTILILPLLGACATGSRLPTSTSAPAPLNSRRVLVIGIDGGKANQIEEQVFKNHLAPHLEKLMRDGKHAPCTDFKSPQCARAHSGPRSGPDYKWLTGPGWGSVLTGVNNSKTLVKDNSSEHLSEFSQTSQVYPTFLMRVRNAGYKVAAGGVGSFISSINAGDRDNGILDYECGHDTNFEPNTNPTATSSCNLDERVSFDGTDSARDRKLAQWIILQIQNSQNKVIMGVLDQVDAQGHKSGFGDNPSYMQAITNADALIGEIMSVVAQRAKQNGEQWLIVISADHGGHSTFYGGTHGATPWEDDAVPFIVAVYGSDVTLNDLQYPVSHLDVHPTVMHWLGAESPQCDGRVQALP
jgi:hypothetical protein